METASSVPELASIVVLCANACEPKSESKSKAAKTGDVTLKRGVVSQATGFKCVGQHCSCNRPDACVNMVAEARVCRLGTVKCNSATCSCREAGRRKAR